MELRLAAWTRADGSGEGPVSYTVLGLPPGYYCIIDCAGSIGEQRKWRPRWANDKGETLDVIPSRDTWYDSPEEAFHAVKEEAARLDGS